MKFCTHCGNSVILQIPAGDDRERFVCGSCELIHYSNPRVIVGCVPVYEGKVLLCKRAIEPRKNYWTLPAGFMENGEKGCEGDQVFQRVGRLRYRRRGGGGADQKGQS